MKDLENVNAIVGKFLNLKFIEFRHIFYVNIFIFQTSQDTLNRSFDKHHLMVAVTQLGYWSMKK